MHTTIRHFALAATTAAALTLSFASPAAASDDLSPDNPPLSATLTIDDRGTVNRAGLVTLTGTVTCNRDAWVYHVRAYTTQTKRRFTANGIGWFYGTPCTTTPTTFEMTLTSTGVNFMPGKVTANANAFLEDQDQEWAWASQTQQVRLKSVR